MQSQPGFELKNLGLSVGRSDHWAVMEANLLGTFGDLLSWQVAGECFRPVIGCLQIEEKVCVCVCVCAYLGLGLKKKNL